MKLAKNLYNAWVSNHGWLLSGAGLIVTTVACTVWYLDWVPQLIMSAPAKQAVVSQAIQSQNGILVAQILASAEQKGAKGRIQVYVPSEDQNAPPAYQERFVLDERGMASLLLVVPAREYSMIAFIDANDNGLIDFEDNRATEDFRMPKSVTVDGAVANPTGGLINLPPQIPCLCLFDFAVQPIAP